MSTAGTEQPQLTCTAIVRLAQTCASLPPYILSPDSHPALLSNLASLSSSSSSSSVSEYAQSLLSLIARSPQTPSLSSLLASLLLSYIDLFASDRIPHDSNSLKTLEFFATLLDHVNAETVPRVVDSILEYFPRISDSDDAQIVDLVPRCLNLARNSEGFDRGEFVDRVLECDWSKGLLVKMVSIAGEFPFLDKVRVREFVAKVFDGMSMVDLQDLPSLVYQLLVLASKGLGKKEIVEGLAVFFGSKTERKSSSMARQVEGTVLLHVNFAVKQDPSLGQEVIALVRSDLRSFNHFTIAILLSVARVRRFRESSIETLKTSLLTAYRDYKFAKDCKWLSDDLKADHKQNVQVVEKAMLRSVNESNYGREHIVPSIVQFAFALLESVEEANCKELFDTDNLLGLEGLAFQMVKTLFEGHDMARNEIIEQCKLRILSLKPEQSMAIIRLLGNLVHAYPYAIQEHVPRLKELLDYFTFMDGKVASGTVTSLLPLTKFSRDLQDYAILVMRKAMFRQEEAVRLAATDAIINLILEEKQSKKDGPFSFQDSSSQAGCSQQAERVCSVRSLFQELSGLLQRCLYQQAKVKEALYKGLMKLVLVDPSAGSAVFDLLLPHFLQFYREDGDIELGSCVKSENGKAYIEEPLDCLLHCVSWIMLLQHHNKTDGVLDSSWACFGFSFTQEIEAGRNLSSETFSNALQKIRKSLRSKKLAGILGQTQQSQDGGSASLDIDKRKCCALVLYGIIEVVVNAIANELEKATDISKPDLEKELVEFVELHGSLEKDANLARPGTGTRRTNTHESLEPGHSKVTTQGQNSYLSTSSIFQIMQMIPKLYDSKGSDKIGTSQNHSQQSPSKKSKGSVIISFVLGVCLRHLRLYPVSGQSDPVRTLIYGDIKILGPALMRLINFLKLREKHETGQAKREARGKIEGEEQREYLHLALICLKELVQNCLKNSDPTALLEDMLSVSALPDFAPDDEYEKASRINDRPTRRKQLFILKTLKPLFFELLELSSPNEVEVICSIILIVGEDLPSEFRSSHVAWSIRVCKEKKITNSKVAKSVATLTISLSSPPDDLTITQDIAKELLQVMGSEKHEAVSVSEVYPLLNHSTRNAICSCLLHLIETAILDVDWAVKKLKTLCSTTHKSTQAQPEGEHVSGQVFEENLYSRVESVAKVLASFALMSLKESQAESVIRLVTRIYKHLAQISKLRIAPKGFKQVLPSPRFQKLVEITCRQLTSPLYNFVANMQNSQQENSNGKGMMSKIKRENKCIPDLIFHIEDYEKFLIQLSKATKVNLLRYAKRSTARDFKISDSKDQNAAPVVQDKDSNAGAAESNEETEAEKVLSPESGCGVTVAEDSEPDEGDGLPNGKRMRIDRVVRDSDEEA